MRSPRRREGESKKEGETPQGEIFGGELNIAQGGSVKAQEWGALKQPRLAESQLLLGATAEQAVLGTRTGSRKGLLRSETLAPCDNGASYVIRNRDYKPNSGHRDEDKSRTAATREGRGARPCERHWGSGGERERERNDYVF